MAARIILFFMELFASSRHFTNLPRVGASNGFFDCSGGLWPIDYFQSRHQYV
jgi:hypothetical protein